MQIGDNDFLVSYDVTALFTYVPLEEIIQILAKKVFNGTGFTIHTILTPVKET